MNAYACKNYDEKRKYIYVNCEERIQLIGSDVHITVSKYTEIHGKAFARSPNDVALVLVGFEFSDYLRWPGDKWRNTLDLFVILMLVNNFRLIHVEADEWRQSATSTDSRNFLVITQNGYEQGPLPCICHMQDLQFYVRGNPLSMFNI